jgi:hypothetical protein
VLVEIDGKQLNLAEQDGWVIEGKKVKLQGAACGTVQDGAKHAVNIEVQCDIVVPI